MKQSYQETKLGEIISNETFDACAAKHGWHYDNGGNYRDQKWDWYSGPIPSLVLLRQAPNHVAVVRFKGVEPSELWSGQVRTIEDFKKLIDLIQQSIK